VFQFTEAQLNILQFDSFQRMGKDAIGGTESHGSRDARIRHQLQHGQAGDPRRLLQARDGLMHRFPSRLQIGGAKRRKLHPAKQSSDTDVDRSGGIFDVSVRKKTDDGFFLLPSKFFPVSCHESACGGPAVARVYLPVIAVPSPAKKICRFTLRFAAIRGIDVMTAVPTAKGEDMTSISEQTKTAPASAEPKATKTAHAGARRAHVASKKAKSGKKASSAKKAPKGPKREENGDSARAGSKAAAILELLKRPGGATSQELMKATGWQPHSVRGFLSGTIRKKMALTVTSTKGENGERSYSIKA